MLTNSESIENLFGDGNDGDRNSAGFKSPEGRNRTKTVISGISQPVDRQDSLMLCQQLQEQDGFDFMDQSMDLTPYLTDLRGMDENNEDLEPIIDKQRILECDIQMQHTGGGPQYADLTTIGEEIKSEAGMDDMLVEVPETSGFAGSYRPLKEELSNGEEVRAVGENRPTTSTKKDGSEQVEITFIPTIKPRKYSLKPEAEKRNPLYRLKREKNNDAVRRSRTKAKQQQKMKDEQIKQLQSQVNEFGKMVKDKEDRVRNLEHAIREVEEENRILRAENMRAKNELYQMKRRCRCTARTSAAAP